MRDGRQDKCIGAPRGIASNEVADAPTSHRAERESGGSVWIRNHDDHAIVNSPRYHTEHIGAAVLRMHADGGVS